MFVSIIIYINYEIRVRKFEVFMQKILKTKFLPFLSTTCICFICPEYPLHSFIDWPDKKLIMHWPRNCLQNIGEFPSKVDRQSS